MVYLTYGAFEFQMGLMSEAVTPHPFQIVGETVLVPCTQDIDKDTIKPLIQTLSGFAPAPEGSDAIRCLILQFDPNVEIDLYALRKLTVPLRALKLAHIKVVALDMPSVVAAMIKTEGLDNLVQLIYKSDLAVHEKQGAVPASVPGVPGPAASRPAGLNAQHFATIGQGIVALFQIQYGVVAKALGPTVHNTARVYYPGIAGRVSFSMDGTTGTIAICFPLDVYLKACSSLFKKEFKEMVPMLKDGPAEMLNASLGRARTQLSQQGVEFKIYIPNAVYPLEGAGALTPIPCVVVHFECDFGKFEVEIGLDQVPAAAH